MAVAQIITVARVKTRILKKSVRSLTILISHLLLF